MFGSQPFASGRSMCCTASVVLVAAAGSFGQCDVYRTGVPDFDQRRAGLDGGGNTFCLPTSAMNWFGFIANKGYPAVLDGPRVWQSQSNYDLVTDRLELLGEPPLMNTNVEFGTTLGGARRGAQIWLDSFAPGAFVVEARGASSTYEPSPLEAYVLLSLGSLPMTCFGRYTFTPAGLPANVFQPRWVRAGGHCVTLTRVYDGCSAAPEFWYRDPAGFDGNNTTQAQFVTQRTDLQETTLLVASSLDVQPVVRTRWFRSPDSNPRNIYDGLVVIHPVQGLSAGPTQGQVVFANSYNFDTLTAPPQQVFNIPGGGVVQSVLFQPARPYALVVMGQTGGDVLMRLNLLSGVVDTLRPLSNAGPCTIDRRGELHIYADRSFQRINTGVHPPVVIQAISTVPQPSAMTHDDRTGRTLMIVGNRLGTVSPAANTEDPDGYMSEDFPPGVTPPTFPSMCVHPMDGSIIIAGDQTGPDAIHVLNRNATGALVLGQTIVHSLIVAPRNVQATARGTIVFTSGGVVRELKRSTTGQWIASSECPLVGTVVGGAFELRAARMIRGDWTDTPSDFTTTPPDGGPGVPDCAADFNGDGEVNPDDLADYLGCFFEVPPCLGSDFNDDSTTNPDDLADFIGAFFAGCR